MNTSAAAYQFSPVKVKRSFSPTMHDFAVPSGTGRVISYGDRIFVRVVEYGYEASTLAEFTLCDVRDMSEIFGELRLRLRGRKGLTRLYVRNITRGWSQQQPFKLYGEQVRNFNNIAQSVTRPLRQPEAAIKSPRRQIPESIALRYCTH